MTSARAPKPVVQVYAVIVAGLLMLTSSAEAYFVSGKRNLDLEKALLANPSIMVDAYAVFTNNRCDLFVLVAMDKADRFKTNDLHPVTAEDISRLSTNISRGHTLRTVKDKDGKSLMHIVTVHRFANYTVDVSTRSMALSFYE